MVVGVRVLAKELKELGHHVWRNGLMFWVLDLNRVGWVVVMLCFYLAGLY